jgi:hypothetical protein
MALKSWQTNKKNNAPQKKGQGKEKPTAKTLANEKKAQHAVQDAEARPETATSSETTTSTLAVTEHAGPYANEEPADEIHEPTETDIAAAETPEKSAEETRTEQIASEADEPAPANEPEAEATHAEPVLTAQTEPAESTPAHPEPAAAQSGAKAEVMAAPDEMQAAGEVQAQEETQAVAPALAEPAPAETASAEPAPAGEATVATEQPTAAMEPAPLGSIDAGPAPTPASEKTQPRGRDPRLPPPGTVLQRRDRHGNIRCECTVEQDGIRYAGKLYKSLSAAAIAATKDMGLKSKTQNGHTFWGVAKPARPAKSLLESLESSWDRYREHAEAVAAQNGANQEERVAVRQALEKHAETLTGLRARVA